MANDYGEWTKLLQAAVDEGNVAGVPPKTSMRVDDAGVEIGHGTGVSWWLHEVNTGRWYSCYYDSMAGDMCCRWTIEYFLGDRESEDLYREEILKSYRHWTGETSWETILGYLEKATPEDAVWYCPCGYCEAERDQETWLWEEMMYATDWENWTWEGYDDGPPSCY